jgi:hypothetical protein
MNWKELGSNSGIIPKFTCTDSGKTRQFPISIAEVSTVIRTEGLQNKSLERSRYAILEKPVTKEKKYICI